MLRLGSLSAFHSGLAITLVWPVSAWIWWTRPEPEVGLALLAALVLTLFAAVDRQLPDVARLIGALLAVGSYAALAMYAAFEPLVVLASSTIAVALGAGITGTTHAPQEFHRQKWTFRAGDEIDAARGVAFASLAGAVLLAVVDREDTVVRVALTGMVGFSAAALAVATFRASHEPENEVLAKEIGVLPLVGYVVAAALCGVVWIPIARPQGAALAPLAVLLLTIVVHASRRAALRRDAGPSSVEHEGRSVEDGTSALRQESNSILEWISERPPRALVVSFGAMGIAGGVVLALPVAAASESAMTATGGVPLLDALFTAFSAVCVTGLIVLDTPGAFSFVGELVILGLIQIGGLGIMTFSTAAYTWLGGRMSVKQEATAARLASVEDRRQIGRSVRTILTVTFVAEFAGALALFLAFWSAGDDVRSALWRGVFTSVSAFCNAGFALQSDSLIGYQHNPLILLICAVLIVVGGLGPLVVAAGVRANLNWIRPRAGEGGERRPLVTQAKIIVATSALLVVLPWMAIAAFEWNNTLDHMSFLERLVNALFQSVTLRTAGFNSVDFRLMHPATLALSIPLMFIGGSPGSTAGGIKTTTIALLALNVRATLRSDEATVVDGMALKRDSIRNASAVLLLGGSAVFVLTLVLLLTQSLSLPSAVFEATSALATVGLSVGGTAELDEVGKVAVLVAMFAGRVGPLTLLLGLASPGTRGHPSGRYPETEIEVG